MEILFLWFVLACLGWLIGQRKGRPLAGFVWGALLGPFGWLLIWLGPTIAPPDDQRTPPPRRSPGSTQSRRSS